MVFLPLPTHLEDAFRAEQPVERHGFCVGRRFEK